MSGVHLLGVMFYFFIYPSGFKTNTENNLEKLVNTTDCQILAFAIQSISVVSQTSFIHSLKFLTLKVAEMK